jgi:hypothetical protein
LNGEKSATFGIPSVGFWKSNFLLSHGLLEDLSDVSGLKIEEPVFL